MSENKKREDKKMLAIPGGAILGLGIGFFFFPSGVFGYTSIFAFTGCILGGLGLGLLIAALISHNQNDN